MQFLRFLESIRTGVGDFFFATVTHMGEEVFYKNSSITVYCEAEYKPDGWHFSWNWTNSYGGRTRVVWDCTAE